MQRGGFGSTGVGSLVRNSIRLAVAGACRLRAAANVTNHCSKSVCGHLERWLKPEKRTWMFLVLTLVPRRAGGGSWQLFGAYRRLVGSPSFGEEMHRFFGVMLLRDLPSPSRQAGDTGPVFAPWGQQTGGPQARAAVGRAPRGIPTPAHGCFPKSACHRSLKRPGLSGGHPGCSGRGFCLGFFFWSFFSPGNSQLFFSTRCHPPRCAQRREGGAAAPGRGRPPGGSLGVGAPRATGRDTVRRVSPPATAAAGPA